jgi:hypothetical protein
VGCGGVGVGCGVVGLGWGVVWWGWEWGGGGGDVNSLRLIIT